LFSAALVGPNIGLGRYAYAPAVASVITGRVGAMQLGRAKSAGSANIAAPSTENVVTNQRLAFGMECASYLVLTYRRASRGDFHRRTE
jgi:hypothetical protein